MPFPIMAAVAGAGMLGNWLFGRKSTKDVNTAQLELAKYQADRNEAFVREQNLYNTPANQMARFSEAGLNPHLIYGQGNAGNQAVPVRFEAPNVQPMPVPDMGGALDQYMNLRLKSAQIDNVQETNNSIKIRNANDSIRTGILAIQAERDGFDLNKAREFLPYQSEVLRNQAKKSAVSVEAEVQRLKNLSRDEQLKLLRAEYERNRVSMQDIEREKRQADLLFRQNQNRFRELGITENDNVLLRLLIRALSNSGVDPVPSIEAPRLDEALPFLRN